MLLLKEEGVLDVSNTFRIHGVRDLIIIASLIWFVSYIIHAPTAFGGTWIYSDITYIIVRSGINNTKRMLIPYRDYYFEYPPIVAMLFIIVNLVVIIFPSNDTQVLWFVGYSVMSFLVYIHAVGTVIILHRLVRYVDRRDIHILMYYIVMPSFLIYSNYNWDTVGIFYALLGLYLFLKGKKHLSFIAFGLAAAGKIIPAVVALAPVSQLYAEKANELAKKTNGGMALSDYIIAIVYAFLHLMISIGIFLLANLPFMIISFDAWYEGVILHHARWYVECSWLIMLFNPYDPSAKLVSIAVITALIIYIFTTISTIDISKDIRVVYGSAAFMSAYLFGAYVFTPQMSLLVLPLLVLVPVDYVLVFIFDALNAIIILTWFTHTKIYSLFGVDLEYGALDRLSIPQIAATLRCFVLLIIVIKILRKMESGIKMEQDSDDALT